MICLQKNQHVCFVSMVIAVQTLLKVRVIGMLLIAIVSKTFAHQKALKGRPIKVL